MMSQRMMASEHTIFSNGDWVRGAMIGKGGFGDVHMALLNKECGRQFKNCPRVMAVKSANDSTYNDELSMEKFLLDRFSDCPFIIRCFGDEITITSDGLPIYNVFLEFAGGGTLADLIKEDILFKESTARRHTRSILEGLKRIHQDGFIHCDLKLENILLVKEESDCTSDSPKFVAKIADFGLTKRAGGRSLRGSPSYWSPEMLRDQIQEQPSDIWALGCIVFGMLNGKIPMHYWKDLCYGEAPDIPSGMSTEAEDFLNKCFHEEPKQRPTAEMLLRHPFVCRSTENEVIVGSKRECGWGFARKIFVDLKWKRDHALFSPQLVFLPWVLMRSL